MVQVLRFQTCSGTDAFLLDAVRNLEMLGFEPFRGLCGAVLVQLQLPALQEQ